MIISKLIQELEKQKIKHGDVEVTMQATMLHDGEDLKHSSGTDYIFESTVETLQFGKCWLPTYINQDGKFDRVRLYYQI